MPRACYTMSWVGVLSEEKHFVAISIAMIL